MHICFVSNEYPKEGFAHGGVGTFLKTLGPKLVAQGHKVTVVGINYLAVDEFATDQGVAVFRLKKNNVKGITWWLNARAITEKIHAIHEQSPIDIIESAELGLAFIGKIKGIKYVIRLHGGHHFFAEAENRGINWWKGFQEKRSFRKADAFIAVSEYVKNHTKKFLSIKGFVRTVYNFIDTDHFKPCNIKVQDKSIVFAGTVCEKKGVRQLIQAFPSVKQVFPEATLHIFGRDWFFPDGRSYIEMLKTEELPKIAPYDTEVFFKGTVSYGEIPAVYAKAEVCVFPSHMETLGLVAPEAMACAKPVVFTALGPGPEVIENGYDGLLVDPDDPDAIARAIVHVFSDAEGSKLLAFHARNKVLDKFNPAKVVQQNIDFYKSLLP